MAMLEEVMQGFDDVYIVLDAPDEFPKSSDGKGRNDLLECIQLESLHFRSHCSRALTNSNNQNQNNPPQKLPKSTKSFRLSYT